MSYLDAPSRDAKGRMLPGHTGNKNGRSKLPLEIRKARRDNLEEVFVLVCGALRDTQEDQAKRMAGPEPSQLEMAVRSCVNRVIETGEPSMLMDLLNIVMCKPELADERVTVDDIELLDQVKKIQALPKEAKIEAIAQLIGAEHEPTPNSR